MDLSFARMRARSVGSEVEVALASAGTRTVRRCSEQPLQSKGLLVVLVARAHNAPPLARCTLNRPAQQLLTMPGFEIVPGTSAHLDAVMALCKCHRRLMPHPRARAAQRAPVAADALLWLTFAWYAVCVCCRLFRR